MERLTLVLPMFVFLLAGCMGTVNYKLLHIQTTDVVQEGQSLIKEGKTEEGLKMLQVAKQLYPDDPTILAAEKKVPPEQLARLTEAPMLGINRSRFRSRVVPTTLSRILWYIPDRLKDLVDIVTLDANMGPQLGFGAWGTRAAQAVAYAGSEAGWGYHQKTLVGVRAEQSAELVAGPVGASLLAGGRAGIGGVATTISTLYLHTPGQPLYQEYRDYWAVGAKLGLFVAGAEAEVHPLEIVDFLAGLILLDPLGDDMATSRRLNLTSDQKSMIRVLNKMVRNAGAKGRAAFKEKYPTVLSQ